MRCYFFTNMYMLGLQAGIQSQHSGQRLCNKYGLGFEGEQNSNAILNYKKWAREHETSILLNAGYEINLKRLISLLESSNDDNKNAWASFNESKEALNGALTSVCVVLREEVYKYSSTLGPLLEDLVELTENGKLAFKYSQRKDVCIDSYMYLSVNEDGARLFNSGVGADDKTIATYTLTEIGIILFMFRLRLAT